MTLKLSIPALSRPSGIVLETRPRQVKEWLEALPLANGFEAARKLTDALVASRGVRLSEEARLRFLGQYRQTIHALLPALRQEYEGRPLPLGGRPKQAAQLARELVSELTNGYKLTLMELAQRRIVLGGQKLVPLAAARIVEGLGELLDICYETYAPTPAGLWAELNQVYWYAAREQHHDTPLPSEEGGGSVNDSYKRILLTALADPYRLLQGQLARVKAYLARTAGLALLQPVAKADVPHGLFLVRLDEDRPPRPLAQHSGATDARSDILLNTLPFVRHLHQQLQAVEAGRSAADAGLPEAADPATRALLKRLLPQWGLGPKRVFQRLAADQSAYICTGLSALYHTLAGTNDLLGAARPEQEEEMQITVQLAQAGDRTGQHATYNCATWQVVNESAGGVALVNEPQGATRIRVGDVIGLRTGQGDWGIAAVRWIQTETGERLHVGAQFVAPRALPVAVRPTITAADAPYQPALLLPAMPTLKQPERLLATRGTFHPRRELELRSADESRIVRAGQLLEQTDSFEIFAFE
ncbi:hypothetical protein [Thiobacter aerophilum]|uniref:Molecular chaperone n=1 Tax=Thiobacter aerophilum TaxID=3121275 RepID=A0ABV0EFC2_9BURK